MGGFGPRCQRSAGSVLAQRDSASLETKGVSLRTAPPPGRDHSASELRKPTPARTTGVRRIPRPKQGGDERRRGSAEFKSEPRASGNSKAQGQFRRRQRSLQGPVHPRPLPPTSLPAPSPRGLRGGEGGRGLNPQLSAKGAGPTLLPAGKEPPAGREAGPSRYAGEGAHHRGQGAQSAGAGRGRYLGRSREKWSWGTGSRCPPAARASG